MEQAETGARRSTLYTKGTKFPIRHDLIFLNDVAIRRLGETMSEGQEKYGTGNWMHGFQESVYINHLVEHLRMYMSGNRTEDHLAHLTWNVITLMWIEENKPELMDLTNVLAEHGRIKTVPASA